MNKCGNCGHAPSCVRSLLLNNIDCSDYINDNTYTEVYHHGSEIPTYEEFHKQIEHLTCEQQLELITLFEKYVEKLKLEWNTRYFYCNGCKKYVERDDTYLETHENKEHIKCNKCHTTRYINNKES